MWNLDPSVLGQIALRTALVYLAMVLLIRLSGKRQIGQMTPFDLVVLLLISNAVQNAMTGPDTSVTGGIVAAIVLLALNFGASWLRLAHPTFRRILVGSPVTLVQNGQIQFQTLKHEGMTLEDLMATIREHDCATVDGVALATLEVDGEVSVVRKDTGSPTGYVRSKKRLIRHHKR